MHWVENNRLRHNGCFSYYVCNDVPCDGVKYSPKNDREQRGGDRQTSMQIEMGREKREWDKIGEKELKRGMDRERRREK